MSVDAATAWSLLRQAMTGGGGRASEPDPEPSAPIAVKSLTQTAGTSNPITVVTSETPEPTAIGDRVFVFHGNDFYTLANMVDPVVTGTPPTLALVPDAVADGGANLAHIKTYSYIANVAGAQTISATETGAGDEDKSLTVLVLANAGTVDDAANHQDPDAETFQDCPAVNPTTADAYLVMVNNSGGGGSTTGYTPPASITGEYEEYQVGGISGFVATKQLDASGDTGTFTFQADSSTRYASVTVAVRTA